MLKDVSSEVQPRGLDDVKQEYSNTAFRVGDLTYQIYTLSKEVDLLKERMTDLNLEGAKMMAAQPKTEEAPKNE